MPTSTLTLPSLKRSAATQASAEPIVGQKKPSPCRILASPECSDVLFAAIHRPRPQLQIRHTHAQAQTTAQVFGICWRLVCPHLF